MMVNCGVQFLHLPKLPGKKKMNMANGNIKMRILPKMPKRHIYQKILKIRALIEMENNSKYQKSKLTKNTKYTKKKQQFNTSF